MDFDIVRYTLCDIELAMVEAGGSLYCSTPQLEKVFKCNRSQLLHICSKWRAGEFSSHTLGSVVVSNQHRRDEKSGSVMSDHVRSLHSELAHSLGLKRFQAKTRLWSEDDVLGFAFSLRSDIARRCRAEFKEILKQHARRDTVPRDIHNKLIVDNSKMAEQINMLWEAVTSLQETNKQMASNAGRSLRLVKG